MDPRPFLRGVAFPGTAAVPYPRAKPDDAIRLPADTWAAARIPVGVRLELGGEAEAVRIGYRTATDELGYRGDGAGRTFALWRDGRCVDQAAALLGEGSAVLALGSGSGEAVVYLPEGMRPEILDVEPVGGWIEPAPPKPRWLCYGDSVAEGWIASGPAFAWPAIAARDQRLDVVNLGYAGAARGEIVSAENVAELPADVISIPHGTNCWTRVPHSVGMFREGLTAFLDVVRQGHPGTPIVVASPVVRPDAENQPNRLGATLSDLRRIMAEVVHDRIEGGDSRMMLVGGFDLLRPEHLGDGIHPNDAGHAILAHVLGSAVRTALDTL